jgi:hypothetical protein
MRRRKISNTRIIKQAMRRVSRTSTVVPFIEVSFWAGRGTAEPLGTPVPRHHALTDPGLLGAPVAIRQASE